VIPVKLPAISLPCSEAVQMFEPRDSVADDWSEDDEQFWIDGYSSEDSEERTDMTKTDKKIDKKWKNKLEGPSSKKTPKKQPQQGINFTDFSRLTPRNANRRNPILSWLF
jgi:hypothetical protein